MSERSAVRSLFDSRLDIIGDIHGELGALQSLLKKLGYDDSGRHSEGRRLVFIGDLVDRGPDSPGVLRTVMRLSEAGKAQCIVGNHELNALRNDPEGGRAGEGWWYGRDEPGYVSVSVSAEEKEESFLPFLRSLPAALERDDLRVVHACWHAPSIESLRQSQSVIDHYHEQTAASEPSLRVLELAATAARDRLCLDIRDGQTKVPLIDELAKYDAAYQMANAVRVVTSGVESPATDSFYSSGKWRMVERVRWWDEFDGAPVVIGHYWRRQSSDPATSRENSASDLFGGVPADAWLGPEGVVMCIDYSVGMRFAERRAGTKENAFQGCLASLRVPEWQLVFDDQRPALSIGAPRSKRSAVDGLGKGSRA